MASARSERCYLGSPNWSDAGKRRELGVRRREDAQERPESGEQRSCRGGGDTRCRRECLLGRRDLVGAIRPLSVDGPITTWREFPAQGDPTDPSCRIVNVFTPAHRYAEIGHSDHEPSYRFGRHASAVERSAFDQEIRPAGRPAQLPDLRPEPALIHRLMEVRNGLAFDQRKVAEAVIAGLERTLLDVHPEPPQFCSDPRVPLVDVSKQPHAMTVPWQLRHDSRHIEKKPPLAISQGEMA